MSVFRKFLNGDQRTVLAKKNIIASIAIKGIDSLVSILLVSVTLGYLNEYEYGIWLTLNSILMWINSFDIGLGNGMRNKLAEAVANGDNDLSAKYVSTTFFMLCLVMVTIIIVGSIVEPYIDWYAILGTVEDKVPRLKEIVYFSFAIFCLNFIFKFIGNVYLAMQLPAVNNMLVTAGHLLSLVLIFLLTQLTNGSLLYVALAYTSAPLIIYLVAYPITFFRIYPWLKPSLKSFSIRYVRDLFGIGIQFFLLQLSGILLFSMANIIISRLFGPEYVTPYNIAYRYFSLVPMIMNLLLAPMWSATTDAYIKGDLIWISNAMTRIRKVLLAAAALLFIMIVSSSIVYRIWIGAEVRIPFSMTVIMAVYTFIIVVSLSYSNFLNGLGKLRIQTINTVIVALLFYPFCLVLGDIYSVQGILIGMCIVNMSGLILNRMQFYKIINSDAKGIWNK